MRLCYTLVPFYCLLLDHLFLLDSMMSPHDLYSLQILLTSLFYYFLLPNSLPPLYGCIDTSFFGYLLLVSISHTSLLVSSPYTPYLFYHLILLPSGKLEYIGIIPLTLSSFHDISAFINIRSKTHKSWRALALHNILDIVLSILGSPLIGYFSVSRSFVSFWRSLLRCS